MTNRINGRVKIRIFERILFSLVQAQAALDDVEGDLIDALALLGGSSFQFRGDFGRNASDGDGSHGSNVLFTHLRLVGYRRNFFYISEFMAILFKIMRLVRVPGIYFTMKNMKGMKEKKLVLHGRTLLNTSHGKASSRAGAIWFSGSGCVEPGFRRARY